MATFQIIVTRDTTESCTLTVEADNAYAANKAALEQSRGDDVVWEQDDTPNASSDHYVTDTEEV